jgi:DNA primase
MKIENLEFYEAVEFLSQKFNIPIQYENSKLDPKEQSIRKQAYEINALAAEWFHHHLIKSDQAEAIRTYWTEQRQFDLSIAREHLIGYAPPQPNALANFLQKKQYSIEALKASGLFFFNERETRIERLKSRFRGRLMIPIRDLNARVVAFTARQLEQTPLDDPSHKAKYVNSPETLLFHKSKILFGMDHARKHLQKDPQFLMVEGQLDAIRCWSVGLDTAIAPQGTAITEEQLLLIRRYEPSRVDCLLDGDSAGRKAALRTLPLTFKVGLEFQYLKLPEKIDPDDLLRKEGVQAIEALRQNSIGPIELLLEEALPKGKESTTQEKLNATQQVFELINHLKSDIAQEDYLKKVSKIIQISTANLFKDFSRFKQKKEKQNAYRQSTEPIPSSTNQKEPSDSRLTQANWDLLYLCLRFPKYGKQIAFTIDSDSIQKNTVPGKYLAKLLAEFYETQNPETLNFESIIESNEERQLLADIFTKELDIEDPILLINKCLRSLKVSILNHKKKTLTEIIEKSDTNSSNIIELMQKRKQISQELIDSQNIAIQ